MATLKPFAALRPKPELAARICELPYDVMSSEEARAMAAGNPLSFLHVSKPEIDLPPGTDLYSPAVYAKGKENFAKLIADGALFQDSQPCFYLYRQIMGGHAQVGLVAAASCQEYLDGIIKKHEFTRPDKEDDRVRHIETLNSQTGPVFLTYKAVAALDEFVRRLALCTDYAQATRTALEALNRRLIEGVVRPLGLDSAATFGVYGQDTWRVSKNVTMNYGLRYEPWFPQQHKKGTVYNFSTAAFLANSRSTVYPDALPGFTYPGDQGFPSKAGLKPNWTNVQPRLAQTSCAPGRKTFAWNPGEIT